MKDKKRIKSLFEQTNIISNQEHCKDDSESKLAQSPKFESLKLPSLNKKTNNFLENREFRIQINNR